jgi:hypothetical protein
MTGTTHGWLCHVLTLCFLLRALVAPGYMPDFQDAHAGALKLVICSAKGTYVVTIGDDGHPLPAPTAHKGSDTCAFAGLSTPATPPSAAGLAVGVPPPTQKASFAIKMPRAPIWRAGPMAGSRAPPFIA